VLKTFVTVDKHQRFKSFVSQTTSVRHEHSSRNAQKPLVSNFKIAAFLQTGLRCFQLCNGLCIDCNPA